MSADEAIARLSTQVRRLRVVVTALAVATAASLFFALRPPSAPREIVLDDGEQSLLLAPDRIILSDGVSSFLVQLHQDADIKSAGVTVSTGMNHASLLSSNVNAQLILLAGDGHDDDHGDALQVIARARAQDGSLDAHRQQGLTGAIAVNLDGQQMHAVLAPTPPTTPTPPPPAPPAP